MKTLSELMQIVAVAIERNNEQFDHNGKRIAVNGNFFISFSGHVERLSIKYYQTGWKKDGENPYEECSVDLNEDGIQEAYWFLKNRTK